MISCNFSCAGPSAGSEDRPTCHGGSDALLLGRLEFEMNGERRPAMYVLLVLGLALLPAAPANAQVTIFNDSSGNSGTIVDLGSNIRSYSDSNGTTGSIVNLGNGIQSYNFQLQRERHQRDSSGIGVLQSQRARQPRSRSSHCADCAARPRLSHATGPTRPATTAQLRSLGQPPVRALMSGSG